MKEFTLLVDYDKDYIFNNKNMPKLEVGISYDDLDKVIEITNLKADDLIFKQLREIEEIKDSYLRYRNLFILAYIGNALYPTLSKIDDKIMSEEKHQ